MSFPSLNDPWGCKGHTAHVGFKHRNNYPTPSLHRGISWHKKFIEKVCKKKIHLPTKMRFFDNFSFSPDKRPMPYFPYPASPAPVRFGWFHEGGGCLPWLCPMVSHYTHWTIMNRWNRYVTDCRSCISPTETATNHGSGRSVGYV